jgi:hypothetical protein
VAGGDYAGLVVQAEVHDPEETGDSTLPHEGFLRELLEGVMKQAASLDMTLPMLLPGVNVKTAPDDFYPIEREQLAKFDGKTWVLFGKVYGR